MKIAAISITAQYVVTHPKVAHNIRFSLIPHPKREFLSIILPVLSVFWKDGPKKKELSRKKKEKQKNKRSGR